MANNCILKCLEYPSKIFLPDMEITYVGRSKETEIKNKKCSRNQVEFCSNYKDYSVKATQRGPNPSSMKGILLHYKESVVLNHGDVIELVAGALKYIVHFENCHLQESCPKIGIKRFFEDKNNDGKKKTKIDVEMVWEEIFGGEILVLNRLQYLPKKKIAAYDMDGTLITTKSGFVFPKSYDDWKIIFSQVTTKLQELLDDNYKLVIFTNQAGIGNGKQTVEGMKKKISDVILKLGVNAQVIVSTGKGKYRKPMTGMWEYFLKECNGDKSVYKNECFYVGDAAGRTQLLKERKKDHSCADRLFAINIGLPFYTPEEHFLGKPSVPYKMPQFDPRVLPQDSLFHPQNTEICSTASPEVILFVGYPGSGKTQFYHTHLKKYGYIQANRDILGSWQKCVSLMEKSLKDKTSVVIDNTNPDIESRRRYLDVAKKLEVPVRCFMFNICLEQAMHNNRFRELTLSSHQKVNTMVYNSYKSKYQQPTIDEGFSEMVQVNFTHNFMNNEQKQLYMKFLLEK